VAASGERTFSSPLARRIAKDAGVDVAQVSGSGPHGRVVKRDVEAAIASGTGKAAAAPQATAAAPAAAPKGMSDDAVLKNFAEGSYELVKHDGMRKVIARRLQESKQTIPHFTSPSIANLMRCWPCVRSSTRQPRSRTTSPPTSSRSTTW
jgi:pyruvate dehydrogenase E2 component (dihydrolipoamide acetyltransferase)